MLKSYLAPCFLLTFLLLLIRTASAQTPPEFKVIFGSFDTASGGCLGAYGQVFGPPPSPNPVSTNEVSQQIGKNVFGYGSGFAKPADYLLSIRLTGPQNIPENCARLAAMSSFQCWDLVFSGPSDRTTVRRVTFNPRVLKLEVKGMSSGGAQSWQVSACLTNYASCFVYQDSIGPFNRDFGNLDTGLPVTPAENVMLETQTGFSVKLFTNVIAYSPGAPSPPVRSWANLKVDPAEPVFFLSREENGKVVPADNEYTVKSDAAGIVDNHFCRPRITLRPFTLPSTNPFRTYHQRIRASGGHSPYTFTISNGSLPAGLHLSPEGVLSGMPIPRPGQFTFTIRATDRYGCTGARQYTFH
jgi:putative Ig domain-containing protein